MRIASSVPGRLRLCGGCLKNQNRLDALGAVLARLDSSCSLRANPAAGSLTVFYDSRRYAIREMEAAVARAAGIASGGATGIGAADALSRAALPAASAAKKRRQINRYAKYAMFGSLGVSLVLAARGAKRGHALSGAAFLVALAAHLARHRKHLLA
ncbi:MAG: hypothetical protein LBU76_04240 [Azoarcus sp.]|jgi:hypothetical protein|nr:hypothetical protein [Azoarcus sp.]